MLSDAVSSLLTKFGKTVTLVRTQSGGTYNTTTGGIIGGSTLTWTGTGVFIYFREEQIDGTAVRRGDRRLLLEADGLDRAPEVGDVVDTVARVMAVRIFEPSGAVVAYDCHVRG